ncbi:MAG: acyltransferase [Nocardioides sp.]|nr:acyltransferase [Nocardioides sp.]
MRTPVRPRPTTWEYHPSLDGLRTLAVYLVVLYHCRVGWLGGGFVGVDLFFVLSGFLVSTILFEELTGTGRLDLAHFYDRRVRRLLPAAVVVVLACCAVSLVFLSSVRRAPLVGDGQAALLYVANWHFLAQSNDYFAAASVDRSLFLHFWSLSIEEQFYLAFPVLLVVLHRLDRAWRGSTRAVLVVLLLASVAAQVGWARVDADHAYYGTETRLYQLLAGALLGLALHRGRLTRPPGAEETSDAIPQRAGLVAPVALVALVGMVLVATPLLHVGASYRGLAATLVGVTLVGSLAASEGHPVARLLARPAPVYLGRISYATYLWHWPLVVLLREVVTTRPLVTSSLVVVLSTGLAAASYQLLERPIRAPRVRRPWRTPVLATGLTASVVAALVVVPALLDRQHTPDLVSARLVSVGTSENAEGPVPDIDFARTVRDKGLREMICPPDHPSPCELVTGQPGPNVMLVGDSHARMLGPALVTMARRHGFNLSGQVFGGCPWPLGLVNLNRPEAEQPMCDRARRDLYTEILDDQDIDVVILTQLGRDGNFWDGMLGSTPGDRDPDPLAPLLYDTTSHTLGGLVKAGRRALVFQSIWLPPRRMGDPLDCLASSRRIEQCRVPVSPEAHLLTSDYLGAAARWPDVHTVDINPLICPAAPVCDPVLDGIPVWRDRNHYSPTVIAHHRKGIWHLIERSGVFDGLLPASRSPGRR